MAAVQRPRASGPAWSCARVKDATRTGVKDMVEVRLGSGVGSACWRLISTICSCWPARKFFPSRSKDAHSMSRPNHRPSVAAKPSHQALSSPC